MICWHRWGKWSDPVNGIYAKLSDSIGYWRVFQMRVCEKCGIAKYRKLPHVRSLDELRRDR